MLMRDVSVARAAATSVMTENIPHAARSNNRARSGASTAIPASPAAKPEPLRRFVFGVHKKTLRGLAARMERASA